MTSEPTLAALIAADLASAVAFDALDLPEPPTVPVLPSLPLRTSLQTWKARSRMPLSPVGNLQREPPPPRRAADPKNIHTMTNKCDRGKRRAAFRVWKQQSSYVEPDSPHTAAARKAFWNASTKSRPPPLPPREPIVSAPGTPSRERLRDRAQHLRLERAAMTAVAASSAPPSPSPRDVVPPPDELPGSPPIDPCVERAQTTRYLRHWRACCSNSTTVRRLALASAAAHRRASLAATHRRWLRFVARAMASCTAMCTITRHTTRAAFHRLWHVCQLRHARLARRLLHARCDARARHHKTALAFCVLQHVCRARRTLEVRYLMHQRRAGLRRLVRAVRDDAERAAPLGVAFALAAVRERAKLVWALRHRWRARCTPTSFITMVALSIRGRAALRRLAHAAVERVHERLFTAVAIGEARTRFQRRAWRSWRRACAAARGLTTPTDTRWRARRSARRVMRRWAACARVGRLHGACTRAVSHGYVRRRLSCAVLTWHEHVHVGCLQQLSSRLATSQAVAMALAVWRAMVVDVKNGSAAWARGAARSLLAGWRRWTGASHTWRQERRCHRAALASAGWWHRERLWRVLVDKLGADDRAERHRAQLTTTARAWRRRNLYRLGAARLTAVCLSAAEDHQRCAVAHAYSMRHLWRRLLDRLHEESTRQVACQQAVAAGDHYLRRAGLAALSSYAATRDAHVGRMMIAAVTAMTATLRRLHTRTGALGMLAHARVHAAQHATARALLLMRAFGERRRVEARFASDASELAVCRSFVAWIALSTAAATTAASFRHGRQSMLRRGWSDLTASVSHVANIGEPDAIALRRAWRHLTAISHAKATSRTTVTAAASSPRELALRLGFDRLASHHQWVHAMAVHTAAGAHRRRHTDLSRAVRRIRRRVLPSLPPALRAATHARPAHICGGLAGALHRWHRRGGRERHLELGWTDLAASRRAIACIRALLPWHRACRLRRLSGRSGRLRVRARTYAALITWWRLAHAGSCIRVATKHHKLTQLRVWRREAATRVGAATKMRRAHTLAREAAARLCLRLLDASRQLAHSKCAANIQADIQRLRAAFKALIVRHVRTRARAAAGAAQLASAVPRMHTLRCWPSFGRWLWHLAGQSRRQKASNVVAERQARYVLTSAWDAWIAEGQWQIARACCTRSAVKCARRAAFVQWQHATHDAASASSSHMAAGKHRRQRCLVGAWRAWRADTALARHDFEHAAILHAHALLGAAGLAFGRWRRRITQLAAVRGEDTSSRDMDVHRHCFVMFGRWLWYLADVERELSRLEDADDLYLRVVLGGVLSRWATLTRADDQRGRAACSLTKKVVDWGLAYGWHSWRSFIRTDSMVLDAAACVHARLHALAVGMVTWKVESRGRERRRHVAIEQGVEISRRHARDVMHSWAVRVRPRRIARILGQQTARRIVLTVLVTWCTRVRQVRSVQAASQRTWRKRQAKAWRAWREWRDVRWLLMRRRSMELAAIAEQAATEQAAAEQQEWEAALAQASSPPLPQSPLTPMLNDLAAIADFVATEQQVQEDASVQISSPAPSLSPPAPTLLLPASSMPSLSPQAPTFSLLPVPSLLRPAPCLSPLAPSMSPSLPSLSPILLHDYVDTESRTTDPGPTTRDEFITVEPTSLVAIPFQTWRNAAAERRIDNGCFHTALSWQLAGLFSQWRERTAEYSWQRRVTLTAASVAASAAMGGAVARWQAGVFEFSSDCTSRNPVRTLQRSFTRLHSAALDRSVSRKCMRTARLWVTSSSLARWRSVTVAHAGARWQLSMAASIDIGRAQGRAMSRWRAAGSVKRVTAVPTAQLPIGGFGRGEMRDFGTAGPVAVVLPVGEDGTLDLKRSSFESAEAMLPVGTLGEPDKDDMESLAFEPAGAMPTFDSIGEAQMVDLKRASLEPAVVESAVMPLVDSLGEAEMMNLESLSFEPTGAMIQIDTLGEDDIREVESVAFAPPATIRPIDAFGEAEMRDLGSLRFSPAAAVSQFALFGEDVVIDSESSSSLADDAHYDANSEWWEVHVASQELVAADDFESLELSVAGADLCVGESTAPPITRDLLFGFERWLAIAAGRWHSIRCAQTVELRLVSQALSRWRDQALNTAADRWHAHQCLQIASSWQVAISLAHWYEASNARLRRWSALSSAAAFATGASLEAAMRRWSFDANQIAESKAAMISAGCICRARYELLSVDRAFGQWHITSAELAFDAKCLQAAVIWSVESSFMRWRQAADSQASMRHLSYSAQLIGHAELMQAALRRWRAALVLEVAIARWRDVRLLTEGMEQAPDTLDASTASPVLEVSAERLENITTAIDHPLLPSPSLASSTPLLATPPLSSPALSSLRPTPIDGPTEDDEPGWLKDAADIVSSTPSRAPVMAWPVVVTPAVPAFNIAVDSEDDAMQAAESVLVEVLNAVMTRVDIDAVATFMLEGVVAKEAMRVAFAAEDALWCLTLALDRWVAATADERDSREHRAVSRAIIIEQRQHCSRLRHFERWRIEAAAFLATRAHLHTAEAFAFHAGFDRWRDASLKCEFERGERQAMTLRAATSAFATWRAATTVRTWQMRTIAAAAATSHSTHMVKALACWRAKVSETYVMAALEQRGCLMQLSHQFGHWQLVAMAEEVARQYLFAARQWALTTVFERWRKAATASSWRQQALLMAACSATGGAMKTALFHWRRAAAQALCRHFLGEAAREVMAEAEAAEVEAAEAAVVEATQAAEAEMEATQAAPFEVQVAAAVPPAVYDAAGGVVDLPGGAIPADSARTWHVVDERDVAPAAEDRMEDTESDETDSDAEWDAWEAAGLDDPLAQATWQQQAPLESEVQQVRLAWAVPEQLAPPEPGATSEGEMGADTLLAAWRQWSRFTLRRQRTMLASRGLHQVRHWRTLRRGFTYWADAAAARCEERGTLEWSSEHATAGAARLALYRLQDAVLYARTRAERAACARMGMAWLRQARVMGMWRVLSSEAHQQSADEEVAIQLWCDLSQRRAFQCMYDRNGRLLPSPSELSTYAQQRREVTLSRAFCHLTREHVVLTSHRCQARVALHIGVAAGAANRMRRALSCLANHTDLSTLADAGHKRAQMRRWSAAADLRHIERRRVACASETGRLSCLRRSLLAIVAAVNVVHAFGGIVQAALTAVHLARQRAVMAKWRQCAQRQSVASDACVLFFLAVGARRQWWGLHKWHAAAHVASLRAKRDYHYLQSAESFAHALQSARLRHAARQWCGVASGRVLAGALTGHATHMARMLTLARAGAQWRAISNTRHKLHKSVAAVHARAVAAAVWQWRASLRSPRRAEWRAYSGRRETRHPVRVAMRRWRAASIPRFRILLSQTTASDRSKASALARWRASACRRLDMSAALLSASVVCGTRRDLVRLVQCVDEWRIAAAARLFAKRCAFASQRWALSCALALWRERAAVLAWQRRATGTAASFAAVAALEAATTRWRMAADERLEFKAASLAGTAVCSARSEAIDMTRAFDRLRAVTSERRFALKCATTAMLVTVSSAVAKWRGAVAAIVWRHESESTAAAAAAATSTARAIAIWRAACTAAFAVCCLRTAAGAHQFHAPLHRWSRAHALVAARRDQHAANLSLAASHHSLRRTTESIALWRARTDELNALATIDDARMKSAVIASSLRRLLRGLTQWMAVKHGSRRTFDDLRHAQRHSHASGLARCVQQWRRRRDSATSLHRTLASVEAALGVRSMARAIDAWVCDTASWHEIWALEARLRLTADMWRGAAAHAPARAALRTWQTVAFARKELVRAIRLASTPTHFRKHAARRPDGTRRGSMEPGVVHPSCCKTWRDISIFMRAMVARRRWRERREALGVLYDRAARRRKLRTVVANATIARRRRELLTLVRRWRCTAVSIGNPALSISVMRLLARGWRRWRAKNIVQCARRLRAAAVADVADKRRKRAGMEALVFACVLRMEHVAQYHVLDVEVLVEQHKEDEEVRMGDFFVNQ